MGSFSLAYYDRIFGARSPAFFDLVGALVDELEDYARAMGPALRNGPEILSRLRHEHIPLVENLKLESLQLLESEAKSAVESMASEAELADLERRFVREALSLANTLTLVPLPDAPEPR